MTEDDPAARRRPLADPSPNDCVLIQDDPEPDVPPETLDTDG